MLCGVTAVSDDDREAQESVDKIAAHRYREQDHSTIYGNAYCWCGWSTSIFNSHKTAIALWAEHLDAVLHPTIETAEELEALPPGSVVLDDDGMVYGYGATGEGDYAWYRGDDYDMPGLPALVIYTGRPMTTASAADLDAGGK